MAEDNEPNEETKTKRTRELGRYPRRVVVVGGGIAGLTAAQELVERGFEVEVVEEVADPLLPGVPLLGGMARSSWAHRPLPIARNAPGDLAWHPEPALAEASETEAEEEGIGGRKLPLEAVPFPVAVPLDFAALKGLDPHPRLSGIDERSWIAKLHALLTFAYGKFGAERENPDVKLVVHLLGDREPEADVLFSQLLECPWFKTKTGPTRWGELLSEATRRNIRISDLQRKALGGTFDVDTPVLVIQAAVDILPAEHGFRFFPSFYRNLFDTMKRIPLKVRVPNDAPQDSARTVFDNLVPAPRTEFGLEPGEVRGKNLGNRRLKKRVQRTYGVGRRRFSSVTEVRRLVHNLFENAGYRGQDIERFVATCVEYLTSSRLRRTKEYEEMTWKAFAKLDAANHSDTFRRHIEAGAQVLVAMSADSSDARTIGSISLQLILDMLRESEYVDGTLNGPTSTAWIAPWEEHLRSQGVKFTLARFAGYRGVGCALRPVFTTSSVRPGAQADDPSEEDGEEYVTVDGAKRLLVAPADYYVMTVPAPVFRQRVMHGLERGWMKRPDGETPYQVGDVWDPVVPEPGARRREETVLTYAPKAPWRDVFGAVSDAPRERREGALIFDDFNKYLAFPAPLADRDLSREGDEGPWRWMTGIQFYFDADVRVPRGHVMCIDSPWGITYLSQTNSWQDRRRQEDGTRGIISAILTRFYAPYGREPLEPKSAIRCTETELANRVWAQIEDAWDVNALGPPPRPAFFALDENLARRGEGEDAHWTNKIRYLVNNAGDWAKRPGARPPERTEETPDPVFKTDYAYAYEVQLHHTVFAGIFMRTSTRLNTMECANESARQAVNAILRKDAAERGVEAHLCPVFELEDYEMDDLEPLRELDRRLCARGRRHVMDSPWADALARVVPWDLGRIFGAPPKGGTSERQKDDGGSPTR